METGDRLWVEGLCPADLFYRYDMLLRLRTSRLREHLNVLVTAAAVTVDGGKMATELDEKLAERVRPRGQPPAANANAPAKPERPLDKREQAKVADLVAATQGLWSNR